MNVAVEWGDTGNGPGFSDYVGPAGFKAVVPKPKGNEWPELKSGQEALHDYEPSEDTPPHRMHTDPPCTTCGEPKRSPDHR